MAESSRTSEDATVTDLAVYKCRFDNMQYCIPENERFRARSNMYCYPNVCSIIKDHLSASDYEQLRRGCMGAILVQGVNMKTNFQLIHHMMLHEVETKKRMEMWFKVGGLISRFSLLEFHVVTGLPCIKSHEGPPEDVSFIKFFGKPRCSYSELLERFKSERKSSPKKLIMAKLLLVEQVLLFRRSKVVSAVHLSLASDPEKFEKYPWGRESYELLFRSLKRASVVDHSDDRAIYEICGYPLAFQAWILEAWPCVANKFECTFKYVEGDLFSLHWACDVRHTYDQAIMLFEGEMEPMFLNYGEFARKPGMEFEEEVTDDIVDYIIGPVFSQTQEDPIYEVRKLRKNVYNLRFGDNAALLVLPIGDLKSKGKVIHADSDDSGDFESPKRSMKRKHEDLEVSSKKQKRKVTEPIIGRRDRSGGLAVVVVDDKKSTANLGMKFKQRRHVRRNDADKKIKSKGIAAERGSGKIVAEKEDLSLAEGCEYASDIDAAVIEALLTIEVRAPVPVTTTNEDRDEIECEGGADKEASPANGYRDEIAREGGDVANEEDPPPYDTDKEHPPLNEAHETEFIDVADKEQPLPNEVHETKDGKQGADKEAYPVDEGGDGMESDGGDDDNQFIEVPLSQGFSKEMPEWAKDLSNRLDRLEEMPEWAKDLSNRLDILEKIISANRDSIVTVADILAKINMLENRFTLYMSMGARGQSSCSIPADPVSEKAVIDVLSAIKNEHLPVSAPPLGKPDKVGG